jgi:membrane protein
VARRTFHGFIRHRGLDAAAALTFFSAIALFPVALIVVSVFAIASGGQSRGVDRITDVLGEFLKPSTVDAVRNPLESFLTIPNPGIALAVGLIVGVWALSGYSTAFGRAVNAVYEVEEGRPFWKFRPLMAVVAVILMVGLALIGTLLLGTPTVVDAIAANIHVPEVWVVVWNVAKWPALGYLAFALAGILYYFTPNIRHLRLRWVSWGAAFAIIAWGLATGGFAIYAFTIDTYNRVYGWVGGAIATLLWLYISNFVLILGAEVDAEIVRIRQLTAGITAENSIQLPLRDTRRNLMLARQREWDEREGRAIRERSGPPRSAETAAKLTGRPPSPGA